ncbi:MAG TPA: HD domain-containing phosphohydrolase [Pirellulales bacterium]|nr:HD domain-containing phosphohydrolase [Pirellulales bacterium]
MTTPIATQSLVNRVQASRSVIGSGEPLSVQAVTIGSSLRRWMQAGFTVFDGSSGAVLYSSPELPPVPWNNFSDIVREVARRMQPRVVEDEDPLMAQAIPLKARDGEVLVAVGLYLTREVKQTGDVVRAASVFGLTPDRLLPWCQAQTPVVANTVELVSDLLVAKLEADLRVQNLEDENNKLSSHITSTFEEISILYRLTHNLKLSSNCSDLAAMALNWLSAVIPAEGLLVHFVAQPETSPTATVLREAKHIIHGRCPLDEAAFTGLVAKLECNPSGRPVVMNRAATAGADWPCPSVRELVVVALTEGERTFGWLAAFNHRQHGEFGTIEANLLSSVAAILGIHSSNLDLYRQQAEVLADVVRAMSSAIDAKDPYTRGHSDRVARVSVRLAQELGCDQDTLKTLYMAGLLHDLGKIGIDDNVLRKPGKLTEAEFEHVKTHVEIGYRILRDLRKMQSVLPVVLHHHESWDGKGYPHGLKGENIPFLARIAAVADAYDAMASDRPYRNGMPDDKLDEVIREGAGKQWDARVVEAFFRVRDDIREISRREHTQQDINALQFS